MRIPQNPALQLVAKSSLPAPSSPLSRRIPRQILSFSPPATQILHDTPSSPFQQSQLHQSGHATDCLRPKHHSFTPFPLPIIFPAMPDSCQGQEPQKCILIPSHEKGDASTPPIASASQRAEFSRTPSSRIMNGCSGLSSAVLLNCLNNQEATNDAMISESCITEFKVAKCQHFSIHSHISLPFTSLTGRGVCFSKATPAHFLLSFTSLTRRGVAPSGAAPAFFNPRPWRCRA